jgi:hypothetical protein
LQAGDDKLRPEVEAAALIDDAASLLLLQDAMKGETSQAFLVLVAQIAMKVRGAHVTEDDTSSTALGTDLRPCFPA